MLWSNELYLPHQFKWSNDHRAKTDECFLKQKFWFKQFLFSSFLHPSLFVFPGNYSFAGTTLAVYCLMKPVEIKVAASFLLDTLKQVKFPFLVHHIKKHRISGVGRNLLIPSSPTCLLKQGLQEQTAQG